MKKRSLSSARKYHKDVIMSGTTMQPLKNGKRDDIKMESPSPESPSPARKSRDINNDESDEDEDDDEDHLPLNTKKSNPRSRSLFPEREEQGSEEDGSDSDYSTSLVPINTNSDSESESSFDQDDASVESIVLYSYHPAKEPSLLAHERAYDRLCRDFFLGNGLAELSTQGPLGIIECLVGIFAVTEPDSIEFSSVKKFIRFLTKEKSKRTTRSGTTLTLTQKIDLNDLIGCYASGKQLSQRSARWNISVLCAISKLVNRTFMVLSPAKLGESVIGKLDISPTVREDFSFEHGPEHFPRINDMQSKSHSADSAAVKTLILRACLDFDSNNVTGFIAVLPDADDADHGLVDTDDDDDDDVPSNFKTASSSILPEKRTASEIDLSTSFHGDVFETPDQKKRITNASRSSLPPFNPYKKSEFSLQKVEPQKQMHEIDNDVDGWGSSPLVLASLKKTKPLPMNRNNNVVFELTHGITDLKTGEKVHLGQFSSHGNLLWYFKAEALNPSFLLWFQVKGPKSIDGPPAACYNTWHDTFIRRTHHGENKYQRRGRVINGNAPYPVNRPCCNFRVNPSGFPVEVLANKFEATFRSMCSDGRVLAEYLFSHLEENATAMLNSFLEGRFRRGDEKNSPYKDSGQLKDMFRRDIEDTFKNGFTRVEFKNHFDKHYCDHTIKEFLISLGYNSFEELKEDERPLIYKSGRFPEWDDIKEEPIQASYSHNSN